MNFRMMIVSHWKVALLLLELGLLAITLVGVKPLGEPIDNPFGP